MCFLDGGMETAQEKERLAVNGHTICYEREAPFIIELLSETPPQDLLEKQEDRLVADGCRVCAVDDNLTTI